MYKVFDKKAGLGLNISKVLPQELHRLLIKKFKRRKVYARLKVDIWGPELAENYCTLLTAPNIYSVQHMFSTNMLGLNLWKLAETGLDGFIKIVNESKRKPFKLWIDQGRNSYNKLMQKRLHDNDILMYLTCNEGKPFIAKRFMRTLKSKISRWMR